jgi:hypothetical protein
MKIFGREPALIITTIGALLVLLASFKVPGVPTGLADAVVAFLTAVLVAVTTRPVAPALFKGVVTAGVALVGQYGLHFSDAQVGSLTAAAMALAALLVRAQVSPSEPTAPVTP